MFAKSPTKIIQMHKIIIFGNSFWEMYYLKNAQSCTYVYNICIKHFQVFNILFLNIIHSRYTYIK